MSEDKEFLDSQEPDKGLDLEELQARDDDDLDTLAEKNKKLIEATKGVSEKNKQLFARAKKAEAKAKEPDSQEPKKPEPKSMTDDQWKKKIDFITGAGRGLSADEIDRVVAFAEGKGISYDLAMEDPYIKAGMETIRTQKKAEAAAVIDETDKSDIEKRYTPEQLKSMPTKDLIKLAESAKK